MLRERWLEGGRRLDAPHSDPRQRRGTLPRLSKQVGHYTRTNSEALLGAEATQTRFDVGMANSFEVATAVNQLTTSRLNELNAVIRYVNAIADFEKKQRVGGGG